jgi:hypothetical protein
LGDLLEIGREESVAGRLEHAREGLVDVQDLAALRVVDGDPVVDGMEQVR